MPDRIKLNLLVGADPELFVRNKKTKQFISAHTLIPGTKEKPNPVDFGATQYDGVAAEFNITPAASRADFVTNTSQVMNTLKKMIGPDNELVIEPTATFDKDYFTALPDNVRELGCNPDFNAYLQEQNPSPDPSDNPFMRTASGHIHIGWTKDADTSSIEHQMDSYIVTKQMDYALGIMSLLWDPDAKRRTLYGKAGCLRFKPYGSEYRTMSNKWLADQNITAYVYNQVWFAMNDLMLGMNYDEEFGKGLAQRIINENITDWPHRKEFKKILNHLKLPPVELPPPPMAADPNYFKKLIKNQPATGTIDVLDYMIQSEAAQRELNALPAADFMERG